MTLAPPEGLDGLDVDLIEFGEGYSSYDLETVTCRRLEGGRDEVSPFLSCFSDELSGAGYQERGFCSYGRVCISRL